MEDNEIMVTEINEGAVEEATDEGSKAASIGGLAAIIVGAAAGVALLTKFVILMRKPKGIHVQQYSYWVYDMGPSEHGYPINYCPVCGKEMKHDEQGSV